jgi:hypothetical protein
LRGDDHDGIVPVSRTPRYNKKKTKNKTIAKRGRETFLKGGEITFWQEQLPCDVI